jgi:sugar lactone lactonase YvrE
MRFNDGRCGPDGRVYAGTMYEPRGRADGRLYRLDTGLTWTELPDTSAIVSNGLAFSRDGTTMYHSDSSGHIINVHAFDAATGDIGPRRTFATVPPPEDNGGINLGRPDGATIDADGYYWSAMYEGQRIVRYATDGTIERELTFPVQCPTMVCFGGELALFDHLRTDGPRRNWRATGRGKGLCLNVGACGEPNQAAPCRFGRTLQPALALTTKFRSVSIGPRGR